MEDKRNDGRADPVKNRRHPRKSAEMDIERAERSHNQEIGQNEGPAACPGAPEATAKIRGKNTDLNSEGPGKRLRDSDGVPHLLLSKPTSVLNELLLHQPTQCHWTAETEGSETEKISDEFADTRWPMYWRFL